MKTQNEIKLEELRHEFNTVVKEIRKHKLTVNALESYKETLRIKIDEEYNKCKE